jgi:hypothetical protein
VVCKKGHYQIVQNLSLSELGRKHLNDSYRELAEERDHVKNMLG